MGEWGGGEWGWGEWGSGEWGCVVKMGNPSGPKGFKETLGEKPEGFGKNPSGPERFGETLQALKFGETLQALKGLEKPFRP